VSSSTRQEILTMLKTQGSMTVSEMAKAMDITEMAVRRHLNTLERDNLIETYLVRQAMGRPTHVYRLSEEAEKLFPRNYSDLTIDFLKDLERMEGHEKIEQLFQRRKERLSQDMNQSMKNLPFEEKVHKLAEIQNHKGYMVDLQQTEEGDYVLKEYNCPISQVAREYTVACECELLLFRELLDTEVERNECYAKGDNHCVFKINNPKARS
jgi:predicted ArsR family transcriptional regulator